MNPRCPECGSHEGFDDFRGNCHNCGWKDIHDQ